MTILRTGRRICAGASPPRQPGPLLARDRPARAFLACIEGILASRRPTAAVIDADLQHDETLLPPCWRPAGGDTPTSWSAAAISTAARRPAVDAAGAHQPLPRMRWCGCLLGIDFTDPMSGHFMIRRDVFEPLAPAISSQGFKILLDILATGRGRLRIVELPSRFASANTARASSTARSHSILPRW